MSDYHQKFCLECKYFDYQLGYPDLSEMAPGWPATMECWKGVWTFDWDMDNLGQVLRTARTCKHFEEVENEYK